MSSLVEFDISQIKGMSNVINFDEVEVNLTKNQWHLLLTFSEFFLTLHLFSHKFFSIQAIQKILVKHVYKDIKKIQWKFQFKIFSRSGNVC